MSGLPDGAVDDAAQLGFDLGDPVVRGHAREDEANVLRLDAIGRHAKLDLERTRRAGRHPRAQATALEQLVALQREALGHDVGVRDELPHLGLRGGELA